MFAFCPGLLTAPALPATTLAGACYSYMFKDCPSLVTAPVLPATTLAGDCYSAMFQGCSNLASIDVSFTSWTETTTGWVSYGVASSGTFTKPAALAETYGVSFIPTGWTVVNK